MKYPLSERLGIQIHNFGPDAWVHLRDLEQVLEIVLSGGWADAYPREKAFDGFAEQLLLILRSCK